MLRSDHIRRRTGRETREPTSRGARFAAGLRATVHLPRNNYECTAFNLSRTGALLVGRFPPLQGYRVDVSIDIPNRDRQLRLAGRVVRGSREGNEQHLALEFVELTGKRREELELLLSRVIEGGAPGPIEALGPAAPPHEVRKALEQVPVPHRITLAGHSGRRETGFLLQDSNPQVLEALARNPNLLPAEARALAASSHVIPSTLELIARDPRWSRDEDVQVALLSHARLPAASAEKILEGQQMPRLRRLLQRSGLPAAVRTEIQKRIRSG